MQHLPSEDPSHQAPTSQNLEINQSSLTNSPIGQGQNVNQASRDINYFFGALRGDWSEEKIEQIRKFEEALRAEFQGKLDKAALLINDLKLCIEHQLTDGNPKEADKILQLLDELQSILGKDSRIQAINEDLEFCHEGGLWLQQNMSRLARCAKEHVFAQGDLSKLLEHKLPELSFKELEEHFLQDLQTYITWISVYLKIGKTPQGKDFTEGLFRVYLDLPQSAYKEAFMTLNTNFVDPIVSGLSTGAANNTANYFNRFIVDRDLSKDSQVSVRKSFTPIFSITRLLSNRVLLLLLAAIISILIFIFR
jgi:hypothetical protein